MLIPLWTFIVAVVTFLGIIGYEIYINRRLEHDLMNTGYVLNKYITKYGEELVYKSLSGGDDE